MILTRDVIRREIEAGRVVIEPFFADQVGPASIDLHLGDEIRVPRHEDGPSLVSERCRYEQVEGNASILNGTIELVGAVAQVFDRIVDERRFLNEESGEIRFVTEVGKLKLDMRFKVGDMIYDGQLEY